LIRADVWGDAKEKSACDFWALKKLKRGLLRGRVVGLKEGPSQSSSSKKRTSERGRNEVILRLKLDAIRLTSSWTNQRSMAVHWRNGVGELRVTWGRTPR